MEAKTEGMPFAVIPALVPVPDSTESGNPGFIPGFRVAVLLRMTGRDERQALRSPYDRAHLINVNGL